MQERKSRFAGEAEVAGEAKVAGESEGAPASVSEGELGCVTGERK